MFNNCTEHFAATLRILEPTIVILQGKAVAKWAMTAFDAGQCSSSHLREAFLGGHRIVVCEFSHPSAHRELRWGDKTVRPREFPRSEQLH
jgi:uracil-DNA glycosylase